MTSGLFLRMVSADHDGVGNLDDIDLGDDFLANYVYGWYTLIMIPAYSSGWWALIMMA